MGCANKDFVFLLSFSLQHMPTHCSQLIWPGCLPLDLYFCTQSYYHTAAWTQIFNHHAARTSTQREKMGVLLIYLVRIIIPTADSPITIFYKKFYAVWAKVGTMWNK